MNKLIIPIVKSILLGVIVLGPRAIYLVIRNSGKIVPSVTSAENACL